MKLPDSVQSAIITALVAACGYLVVQLDAITSTIAANTVRIERAENNDRVDRIEHLALENAVRLDYVEGKR